MVDVARAELVLASPDVWPLREVPLSPDPMQQFAAVMAGARADLGDTVEVAIDLLPLTRGQATKRRRKVVSDHIRGDASPPRGFLTGQGHPTRGGHLSQLLGGEHAAGLLGGPVSTRPRSGRSASAPPRAVGLARIDERDRDRTLAGGLRDDSPRFQVQLLLRCSSTVDGRANTLLRSLLVCFDTWAGGDNWWRVVGTRVGPWFVGSDVWWRRRHFDDRFGGQVFDPAEANVLSATVLAGLITPPTAACAATNVVRSGGLVPPAPRTLPTFTGQSDLLPWGEVTHEDDQRVVAAPLSETYFTAVYGRSRFGKTESELVRFVHLARSGHGCLFVDPHADALTRVKPYLADQADRIIELSIARGSHAGRQVGWNPFATAHATGEDLEDQAAAIVDSIAAAMRWGAINNRALSITQMATQSLLELSRQLPPDTAPTIFQMSTLLSDEDWRETVLEFLSPSLQAYWSTRFPRLGGEAITPITNVIDRMRSTASIAGLLGQSRSTYSLRDAMDTRKIVLVRLRGTSQIDQLIASFIVYDLLRATLSRWNLPPARRWPMHAFLDEVQSYDHSVRGLLASALEEGGKFGLRLHLANQQPTRLAPETLAAVLTNRSHLASTNVGYDSARLLSREWGGQVTPETVMELDKYEFIGQVTHRGQLTTPFRMRGLSLDATYGTPDDQNHDEAALEAAIDPNSGRRPINDVLAELATLDERIIDHLTSTRRVVPIHRDQPPPTTRSPYRPDRVRSFTHGDEQ